MSTVDITALFNIHDSFLFFFDCLIFSFPESFTILENG